MEEVDTAPPKQEEGEDDSVSDLLQEPLLSHPVSTSTTPPPPTKLHWGWWRFLLLLPLSLVLVLGFTPF